VFAPGFRDGDKRKLTAGPQVTERSNSKRRPFMLCILRMSSRFGSDRRGNIAVIFALAIIPVVTMVGAADRSPRTRQPSSQPAA
jgi:hypothetical protein